MTARTSANRFPYGLVPILFGVIFIALGLWIFLAPEESYTLLTKLIGVILLVSGTTQLLFSISNRGWIPGWGFSLFGGAIDLVLGVVLVINPEILLKVVALFVGIWLIVSGINLLVRAREARKVGAGYWKWELGLGITYLALAVIFLWHPMILGITIAIWSALAFIILGIFRIAWTIRLKRHMNKQKVTKV